MEYFRTPDSRFQNLPDYPFKPNYFETKDGLRMHYVDEGQGEVFLLLHGEPSWSYLYRKMVVPLAQAGFRVIAPDLIGFGRSDKPKDSAAYTYQSHLNWLKELVHYLDLKNVSLYCQDWGGLLGLRFVAEEPERFSRVCAANTFLPTGDASPGRMFLRWQKSSQTMPVMKIGELIRKGCNGFSPDIEAAYDAPFPEEACKVAARKFPLLVPVSPDDPATVPNRKAWEVLSRWTRPFLTLFSDGDPITRGGDAFLCERIPGAKGQPHDTIIGAGHFLQEDKGEEIAAKLIAWKV